MLTSPFAYHPDMTRFVIDAVALLDLVQAGRPPHHDHQLVAPSALRSQALDLLLARVNQGAMTDEQALGLHERMTEVKIRLLGDRVSRRVAWDIARKSGWSSVRLAEYLAVTRLQGDALVAGDEELAAAAAELVRLEPVEALFRP